MRNSVLIGLLIFLLSACAKDNAILWSSAKNVDLIFVPTERASEFIYPKTGNGDNLTPAPADVVRDSTDRTASEFNVADTCNPTPYTAAQGKPAFAFLIPIAVAIGVDLILNQINSSMAAEIAKYDAGFSAVNSVQFYKMSKSGGLSLRGGNVVPEYSCIRFVRYEKSEKAGQPASIVFDLVASLNLEKSPESIRDESPGASQKSDAEKIKDEYPVLNPSDVFRITPLRLYYLKSVAESESQDKQGESYKKISLSINLLGNSIWRQRNKGEMS